jgi:hypothetical protein
MNGRGTTSNPSRGSRAPTKGFHASRLHIHNRRTFFVISNRVEVPGSSSEARAAKREVQTHTEPIPDEDRAHTEDIREYSHLYIMGINLVQHTK